MSEIWKLPKPRPLIWLAETAGIAAAYFACGKLALLLAIPPGYATAVWPAAGIAVAGALVFGYRVWLGVFLGSLLVTLSTEYAPGHLAGILESVVVPAVIAGGAALQAVLGAYLVRRFVGFPSDFARLGRVLGTMALGGPVACLTGATIGVASLHLTGGIETAVAARSWGTWWLGDSIGVLAVLPLASAWHVELNAANQRTRFLILGVVLALAGLTVLGFLDERAGEARRAQAEFGRRAEIMARTLQQCVLAKLDIMESIVGFFAASQEVTRSEFGVFVKPTLARHPDLHGLSWNVPVSRERRADFEDAMRQDGYPAFRVTERDPEGRMVRARDRDENVVVAFIEPLEGNEQALGFDLASDPVRATALSDSRDGGKILATPPITLVQETEHRPGFLLFAPIFEAGLPHDTVEQRRRSLRSFVSGVFKADKLVQEALAPFQQEGIECGIADTSDPRNVRVLHGNRIAEDEPDDLPGRLAWSTDLDVGGRRWAVRFWPSSEYATVAQWGKAWLILTGGLLFTSLLGSLLVIGAGRASATERSNEHLRKEIRDRRRAEVALRASEEKLRTVFENAAVGVALIDTEGHLVTTNAALQGMLGYNGGELAAMTLAQLTHPDDLHSDAGQVSELVTASGSNYEMEKRYLTKNGDTVWGSLALSLVRDADGKSLFSIGMVQDVTQRKSAEEERLKLEAALLEAQKLESLGVLAGGIAHDFNNLLVGVLGNAHLAQAELAPGSEIAEHLRDIESAALRAADLANQLLAYSGRGKFVVGPIDLSRLVDELSQLVKVTAAKKVAVEYDLGRDLPAVEADATQLRQVVLNLITNASEAIGERAGVVTLRTGRVDYGAKDLAALSADELPAGSYVYFEVADTGSGMDPETQEKIFDPFFTTKFTGRGLGLAAVRGIVRGHDGAIKVSSELDRGTTIRVLFPASERAAPERPGRTDGESHREGEGVVLLADDEETVRQLLSKVLTDMGFEVLTAVDGVEAVEIFRNRSDDIAVVLLDLTMPRMGGEETFTELRRVREDVKVILISGYSKDDTALKFGNLGQLGFLQKPFSPAVLRDMIRTTLDG